MILMHALRALRVMLLLGAIVVSVFLAGCGGGGTGNGTLQVAMVDGPDPTITALNITVSKIEANINGAWTPINLSVQTFNLLDLAHSSLVVGSLGLPPGHYTQLRLTPSSATVTDATGTYNVNIPSGSQTGIKINIDHDIVAGQVTTVVLDFNVHKSLLKLGNGNYQLQPVIAGFLQVLSGSISGSVTDGGSVAPGAVVSATYTAGPNYPAGTVVNSSSTLADGTFTIWTLLPGTYTVNATFVDAANVTKTAALTGVVVTANHDTAVGALAVAP